MNAITHDNLIVDGFPFTKIYELTIISKPNEHGTASISGEISKEDGDEAIKRTDETTGVLIHTDAEGQNQKLFLGRVKDISLETKTDYYILHMELAAASSMLDVIKKNKTFQNTTKKYGTIMKETMKETVSKAAVEMKVTDKPIDDIVVQTWETDWEFVLRMASRFNAPVLCNIQEKDPKLTVGLPSSGKTYELETAEFDHGLYNRTFQLVSKNYLGEDKPDVMAEDFQETEAYSITYGYVGDVVKLNGKELRIKTAESRWEQGRLMMYYRLVMNKPPLGGFVQPIRYNEQIAGKMFRGIVKEVKKDTVKVHINDIDEKYDGSTKKMFPFSTAYSSQDGSGWYSMPEVEDIVRIFFPTNDEKDGFAVSSINMTPLEVPRYKTWRAPGGKEIILTDDGLHIICETDKIFIDLTDKDGINIVSEKGISVVSKGTVFIQADKSVEVNAKKKVIMGTPDSYIDITPSNIKMSSKKVHIN